VIVPLLDPIEFAGETITELNIAEKVKAKHWKGIPVRNPPLHDDLLRLSGALAAQPDLVIEELSNRDMNNVIAIVAGFLEPADASTSEDSSTDAGSTTPSP
jgi:hypothetical protein